MTAKEYLNQISLLDLKIKQRKQEAKELREMAYGAHSPDLTGNTVQTTPVRDRTGDEVARYLDIEAEVKEMEGRYADLKHKIIGEIQELKDPRMVDLLYLKYVQFMTLEKISCTMKKAHGGHYSYDHIRRLHWRALKEFSKCHSKATCGCDIL